MPAPQYRRECSAALRGTARSLGIGNQFLRIEISPILLALFLLTGNLSAQPLFLHDVTVIDGTGADPIPGVSVLMDAGRIVEIAPDLAPPADAVVVEGEGRFAIPGLWDMHAHLTDFQRNAHQMLVYGVTGVREMYTGFAPSALAPLRARRDFPRLALAAFFDGPLFGANGAVPPAAYSVTTDEEARTAVKLALIERADFLKVYNNLPREAYFAIADEARKRGVLFAGHVPEAVSPKEAAAAGQISQEHLINILLASSTNEEELRAQRLAVMNDPQLSSAARARELGFPNPGGLFETYDEAKAADLFSTFVDYGVWQTPTLVLLKHFAEGGDQIRSLPVVADLDDEGFAAFQQRAARLLERHQQLVGDMHRAGVSFLAGTDASANTPVPYGLGVHEELELLVEAGMTEMEALQTATRNPAFYFGLLTLSGTLEPGKIADIVLLNANPLEDIRNTRQVEGVVMRGSYFPPETLEILREAVLPEP